MPQHGQSLPNTLTEGSTPVAFDFAFFDLNPVTFVERVIKSAIVLLCMLPSSLVTTLFSDFLDC
jgi:hypothetical protein